MGGSFGSPQPGVIRWRSANKGDGEEERDAPKPLLRVEAPKTIQRGRYSNDDSATLTMEDMAAMQGNVQKYTREENRLEEDVVETVYESTVLSEDDPYVKKLRAKMNAKAE